MCVSWLQVRDNSGRWNPYAPPDGGAASARRPVGSLARGTGAEQTVSQSVSRCTHHKQCLTRCMPLLVASLVGGHRQCGQGEDLCLCLCSCL